MAIVAKLMLLRKAGEKWGLAPWREWVRLKEEHCLSPFFARTGETPVARYDGVVPSGWEKTKLWLAALPVWDSLIPVDVARAYLH